jgi:hypothetical protein
MEQQPELLPTEWVSDSVGTYLYQKRPKRHVIYTVMLAAVSAAIISLPFVYVDITVQSSGFVRPNGEISVITAPMTETVERVSAKEGDKLRKGDEILRFRTSAPDGKIKYQQERSMETNAHIADLELLSRGQRPQAFASAARQQEYAKYLSEQYRLKTDLRQYETEWRRYKVLFDKGLISESEYNEHYYRYQDKVNELHLQQTNQMSAWKTELTNLKMQLKETTSNLIETRSNRNAYVVRSPINGTLEQFSGIYPGSNLQVGATIAVVSPDTSLYIEAYVVPRDIAFIREKMRVKVQIESFNYNEWGTLEGYVQNISSDYIRNNDGQSYYKVKCKLTKNYLELRNSKRKGYVKKGMTGIVHFVVTRRSLFNLLYKNIDEWVNPTQYQATVTNK